MKKIYSSWVDDKYNRQLGAVKRASGGTGVQNFYTDFSDLEDQLAPDILKIYLAADSPYLTNHDFY